MKWLRVCVIAPVFVLAAGCEPEEPDDTVCERVVPYRVTIACDAEALPDSTEVVVLDGGGEFTYPLATPPDETELVFCAPVSDTESQRAARLTCDLWNQGAVTITVNAEGYERLEETLAIETQRGCVVTQDVALVLKRSER